MGCGSPEVQILISVVWQAGQTLYPDYIIDSLGRPDTINKNKKLFGSVRSHLQNQIF